MVTGRMGWHGDEVIYGSDRCYGRSRRTHVTEATTQRDHPRRLASTRRPVFSEQITAETTTRVLQWGGGHGGEVWESA